MDNYLGRVYLSVFFNILYALFDVYEIVKKCGHTSTSFSSKDHAWYTRAQFILLLNWRFVI